MKITKKIGLTQANWHSKVNQSRKPCFRRLDALTRLVSQCPVQSWLRVRSHWCARCTALCQRLWCYSFPGDRLLFYFINMCEFQMKFARETQTFKNGKTWKISLRANPSLIVLSIKRSIKELLALTGNITLAVSESGNSRNKVLDCGLWNIRSTADKDGWTLAEIRNCLLALFTSTRFSDKWA